MPSSPALAVVLVGIAMVLGRALERTNVTVWRMTVGWEDTSGTAMALVHWVSLRVGEGHVSGIVCLIERRLGVRE
jgi:hypothetical protein